MRSVMVGRVHVSAKCPAAAGKWGTAPVDVVAGRLWMWWRLHSAASTYPPTQPHGGRVCRRKRVCYTRVAVTPHTMVQELHTVG